jgi:hypothetical protein
MKLVPRTGMLVIDPDTHQALPADGADVDLSSFWIRRLNDGDVSEKKEEPQNAQRTGITKGTEGK